MPKAISLLLSLATALPALAATVARAADQERKEFAAAAIKRVELDNAAGDVRLTATDGHAAVVVATKVTFDAGCRLVMELRGSTLAVSNREPKAFKSHACEVRFELQVPRQVALDLAVGSGNVRVEGVKGSLDYKLGSGNLTLADVELGEFSGRSGSGDVAVTGSVLTETDLKLGAGHAAIALTRMPAKGHLDLKVGTGSTVIRLPKDAKVHTSFKAGLGSLTNEFADSPNAPFSISGSAGAGDMSVKRL